MTMEAPGASVVGKTGETVDLRAFQPRQVGSTTLEEITPVISQHSREAVEALTASGGRRTTIPVRNSFVRSDEEGVTPPLARLIGSRATVALKLYLALIWRCAAPPYSTTVPARHWAYLLDLPSPETLGARRIHDALKRLEEHHLIKVERSRGEIPTIELLSDSGNGEPYKVPWASSDRYFQINLDLWKRGHLQQMSGAALAMLLVVTEESRGKANAQWWSVEVFNTRFSLKKDTRATGTRELVQRRLMLVTKQALPATPGTSSHLFARNTRTRNAYQLINEATPPKSPATDATPIETKRTRTRGRKPRRKRSG